MLQFTVAITVYKTPEFLPRAIQSVLAQTLDSWEVLVYSDGRSKETEHVVEQLQDRMPIRYRSLRRRRGLYGNHLRRLSLEEGQGRHVVMLGHDCLLYPTYLETHARIINGDPKALSVVPVAYWKNFKLRRPRPTNLDLSGLGEGEIDLLCVAYPREIALETGAFGEPMQRIRCADYLSFDGMRRVTPPIYAGGAEQGAHF